MTVSVMPTRPRERREPRFYNSSRDRASDYQPVDDLLTDEDRIGEDGTPSLLSSAATAAAPAARRARTGLSAWLSRSGARVRQVALSVAGLGAFTVAGFEAHPVAGWVVTGLSFLLLEHQVKS